mgnify:FL=1
MVTWEIVKKLAPWILATLVIGSLIWWVSHTSYVAGQRDIQEQWDAERATYKKAMDTLKDQYATLEAKARIDNQRNSDELAEKEKTHAVALVELRREYDGRLLQSNKRASYYQRLAKGGAVEQANLASHAARLDRSLEEGRRMVAELSATIRQRDDQLRAVSTQLKNDRSLFMTGDKK